MTASPSQSPATATATAPEQLKVFFRQKPYSDHEIIATNGDAREHRRKVIQLALEQLPHGYSANDFHWTSGRLIHTATGIAVEGTPSIVEPKASKIRKENREAAHIQRRGMGHRAQHLQAQHATKS